MLLSLSLLLIFGQSPSAPTRAPRWCADAGTSGWAMDALIGIVEADGADAEYGRRLYSLPRITRDSLVLVRDEAVCERASRAYYHHRLGPTPPGGVTVIRVRDRYTVYGAERAGEWTIMSIYSLAFESIVNIAL